MREKFFLVDVITVKGKESPTSIFTEKLNFSDDQIMAFNVFFNHYQKEEWDQAIKGLLILESNGMKIAGIIKTRCEELKAGIRTYRFKKGVWGLDEK
jgi:hypothetical protein